MLKPHTILGSAGLALALTLGSYAAQADTVTWNPNGAGLGAPGFTGGAFTFDTLHVSDYARIHVDNPSTGHFVENGFLNISGVHDPVNGDITPSGLTSLGAGSYSLYLAFTATGTSTAHSFTTPGTYAGAFDTLTYTLYGVNGHSTFSTTPGTSDPAVANTATPIVLGMGSLIAGNNTLVVAPGSGANHSKGTSLQISPSAAPLSFSFVPNTAYAGFFAEPMSDTTLTLSGAFTNNFLKVTLVDRTTITINAGGGDITPTINAVPEPASLALLGSAMLGIGLVRLRRRG